MATHDYVIANGTGSAVRSDINNVLAAIVSTNSSSTEPSTKYAYQFWADTNSGYLKIRNAANNGWVQLFKLDATLSDIPVEGTVVKSTGESGGTKFLREDGDGTCSWQTPEAGSSKNLIINGSQLIAQRGTSSTSSGYQTIDRFPVYLAGLDESPTQAQVAVASGTTPYTLGFRKALKVTNGNQTSGANTGSTQYIWVQHKIEAQDIANSGWNYLSASSYITLSFWVRSSVAQTFKGYIETMDGTAYQYPFETGSLSADTWTKITKSIPGNSNLTFDDNNGEGFKFSIVPFISNNKTASSVTENAWSTYNSSARMKDSTTTWYTTNDATFELTGVQLEVGSVASDFEHRSFAQELARCQRYFFAIPYGSSGNSSTMIQNLESYAKSATEIQSQATFPVPMRTNPSFTGSATDCEFFAAANSADFAVNGFASYVAATGTNITGMNLRKSSASSMTAGQGGRILFRENGGYMHFSAEL